MYKFSLILLIFAFLGSVTAFADEKSDQKDADHELAMSALKNGEVMPIMKILALVQEYQPGEVIEVELESKKGELYYEVEILSPSGVIVEVKLDARTGWLLKVEVDK